MEHPNFGQTLSLEKKASIKIWNSITTVLVILVFIFLGIITYQKYQDIENIKRNIAKISHFKKQYAEMSQLESEKKASYSHLEKINAQKSRHHKKNFQINKTVSALLESNSLQNRLKSLTLSKNSCTIQTECDSMEEIQLLTYFIGEQSFLTDIKTTNITQQPETKKLSCTIDAIPFWKRKKMTIQNKTGTITYK